MGEDLEHSLDVKKKQKPLYAPEPFSIDQPGDLLPQRQTERAGIVSTLAEKRAYQKDIADISMRKVLAIMLTSFVLVCMGAYFVYMLRVNDPKGLSDFITILVGMLGVISGYYFGSGNEVSN